MMFAFKIDGQLQLRLLETQYTEELYRLTDRNRQYLREWLPWVDETTSAENTKVFIQSSLSQFAASNGFQAGIFVDGKIGGCIGLHGVDWNNKKTSIGYWLASEYQGQGVMTRSCRAIVDYALDELKLNRVEIRAAEFNRKSRAIPERLGFAQEGISRQAEWLYDHYVDHVIYGMLAENWRK